MCDGQIYFVLTFVVVHHELKQHVKLADLFCFSCGSAWCFI